MAVELVDILLRDATPPNDPITGVSVFVYDSTGTTLITSGLTDGTGHVQFMLPGTAAPTPTTYQLRTYKQGISSPQPVYVEVYSPPAGSPTGTNNFRVDADVFVLPQSIDPHLCRVSGYIRGPDGRPKRGADIHFIYRFNPLIVDGAGVIGERVACRTDKDGYVQIDLWRNGCYRAIVEGNENVGRSIHIPDLPAANISYVLFPRVYGVTFTPPGPWVVGVGSQLVVNVQVQLTSGYVTNTTAREDVTYRLPSGDPTAAVQVFDDRIVFLGANPGTAALTVSRVDNSLSYVPDDPIVGTGNTVTVV